MKASPGTFRALAVILAAMLALMTLLSVSSQVPCIEISSLQGMDGGQSVLVFGLLVDLWVSDSGSESLILVDREESSTVRVLVAQAFRPPPSTYAHIGDELRVAGDLALSRNELSIYSDSDCVVLLAKAEQTLTVKALSTHWALFLGDELSISGILMQPVASMGPRLFDVDMAHSVSLRIQVDWDIQCLGRGVLVHGKLTFDENSMIVVLEAHEVRG